MIYTTRGGATEQVAFYRQMPRALRYSQFVTRRKFAARRGLIRRVYDRIIRALA